MADLDTGESGSHGKKGHGVRAKKMSTRIDMTPMVDLAFLLVTFFMLTTTMAKPKTMELVMPDNDKDTTKAPEVNESEVLTLILDEANKIYYYTGVEKPELVQIDYTEKGLGKIIDDRNVVARSFQRSRNKPDRGVFILIKPMDKSSYSNLVDVLDEMKIHNIIPNFGIFNISDKEKDLVKTLK